VELLRPRVVAQEENGGLREGPLEVDVALLAAGSAPEFAGGFASRGHEPGVGGELLESLERTRWAPAVRLRRFGIVARRSAPDPLDDQGTSGGSPEFLRKGRG
jgi:hypothetical protein